MTTIPQVSKAIRTVLGPVAEEIGGETGFVRRVRKLDGSTFARTLIFGWLTEPEASLEELAQTAATMGVVISAQGLDQRFTPAAAEFLADLLQAAITQMLAADPVAVPLLQRFQGVYIQDSTTIRLPDALAEVWPGCGGSGPGLESALKLQVRLELSTGRLEGPFLTAGRVHDRTSLSSMPELPKGAVRLNDLGYFSLALLAEDIQEGRYWLSRLQTGTAVFDSSGGRQPLSKLLQSQMAPQVDLQVQIGVRHRLPCRLVAVRVPQEVADQRRARLHDQARRRQQPVSAERLALADWTVLITNLPQEQLSLTETLVLARARWQIELLFKLWKSHGQINRSNSKKPWRILCEVYAKLLAMLIAHWMFLLTCWRFPNRSLVKARKTIQKHALGLAITFSRPRALSQTLASIQRCLATGCRINKRKKDPNTYQLLLNPLEGVLS